VRFTPTDRAVLFVEVRVIPSSWAFEFSANGHPSTESDKSRRLKKSFCNISLFIEAPPFGLIVP
jgi:hypothetical protein